MEYKDIEWRVDCIHYRERFIPQTRMQPGEEQRYCFLIEDSKDEEMDEEYHCTEYCIGYEFDPIVAERLKAEAEFIEEAFGDVGE